VSNVEEGIKHSIATLTKIKFCVVSRSLLSRKIFNSSPKKNIYIIVNKTKFEEERNYSHNINTALKAAEK
jgi:hypothetical protein